jgi:hypothetical protein
VPIAFLLNTGILAVILAAVIFGATFAGLWIGRSLRDRGDTLREPLAVLQGSLLAVVGLILAFGLTLAVGRYEARKAAVVDDANAIGTTNLRAQTLPKPIRSNSLQLLKTYTDTEIALSDAVPGSDESVAAAAAGSDLQRQLWSLAGQALDKDPIGSATRLYVDSLNATIEAAGGSSMDARWEVLGAAAALGLLAVYLAVLGRVPCGRAGWLPPDQSPYLTSSWPGAPCVRRSGCACRVPARGRERGE